eukprot:m.208078 g.208078  ORF g.208078 m.208078 type:complete len:464 (-) comp18957_c1_seq2:2071-3462(-)
MGRVLQRFIISALFVGIGHAMTRAENPFTDDDIAVLIKHFLQNIDVSSTGAVIASPSTTHPDYYYHWVRDGAISMDVLLRLSDAPSAWNAPDTSVIWSKMKNYAQFGFNAQSQSDPNGIDVEGEPKYYAAPSADAGKVYDKPWGRPQNDSPALRALSLIHFAKALLSTGSASDKDYVQRMLYNADTQHHTVIKQDLEYVSHHWGDKSFDLWEEIEGFHFFTRAVQHRALTEGAAFARVLGDTGAAAYYTQQAAALLETLDSFVQNGVVIETLPPHGGTQKFEELDSAVTLGVIYGNSVDSSARLGKYTIGSSLIDATNQRLDDVFSFEYSINAQNSTALWGRYPNDTYNGYEQGQLGNPWVLTTCAAAEYQYRLAALHLGADADVNVTATHTRLAQRAMAKGDAYLARVRHFLTAEGLHLPEELNRDTGAQQGANDLTWSYGTAISASLFRQDADALLRATRF